MNSRLFSLILACTALGLAPVAASPFLITQLPTQSGNVTWSVAYDINNAGQIVGTEQLSGGPLLPVMWSGGSLQVLWSTAGTFQNLANSISTDGKVLIDGCLVYPHCGYVWNAGVSTQLAEAIKLNEVVITSSPGPMPCASRANCRAVVPEDFETLNLRPSAKLNFSAEP